MDTIKAAAYCRVSTEKDDQVNSLASQRRYFTEYIVNHRDWELDEIYYDEGISGTQTAKRVGFNRMIREACEGKIDLILTKEVSRFARNTVDTLYYTRKLKALGVGVIFTIDNIDTREQDGELRLTIMASIAQEESRKTSERVKWGQKRRMEQGVVFGRELLGYEIKDGRLYVKEEEAGIVRAIFHKYTNEEKGSHVIARELYGEGMRPKRGEQWTNASILRILRNEKYVGDLCQKKTITPDYLTHRKKCNQGEEEMIYISRHHEAIVDRDLWERTQETLRHRSASSGAKAAHSSRYWCSGKIICGQCGRGFVSRTKKRKDGSVYRAWRCYENACHGKKKSHEPGNTRGCDNGTVSESTLLSCVSYVIGQVPLDREALTEEILHEIQKLPETAGKEADMAQLNKKRAALELKKRKAVDLLLEGMISREDFKRQTEWYEGKIEAIACRLQMAEQERNLKGVLDIKEIGKAVEDILELGITNEVMYREVLDKIVVDCHDTLSVRLKGLPSGLRMKVKTTGKKEEYTTEIVEVELFS